jgi:hypothetical protein
VRSTKISLSEINNKNPPVISTKISLSEIQKKSLSEINKNIPQ